MRYFSIFSFLVLPYGLAYFLHKNTVLRDKIKLEALTLTLTLFIGAIFISIISLT